MAVSMTDTICKTHFRNYKLEGELVQWAKVLALRPDEESLILGCTW